MKVSDSPPNELEAIAGVEFFNQGYLAVAATYCRKLGLVDLINRLVPSKMSVSPGIVVQAMIWTRPSSAMTPHRPPSGGIMRSASRTNLRPAQSLGKHCFPKAHSIVFTSMDLSGATITTNL